MYFTVTAIVTLASYFMLALTTVKLQYYATLFVSFLGQLLIMQ